MLRPLFDSLWPGRAGGESDGDDEDEDDRRDFVRSVLDASVLTGHGGGNPAAERELATLQREAETLEAEERHRD